jgi:hypothetical protein
MYKKLILTLFIQCCTLVFFAQVADDFSDGELLNNPTWVGETSLWQVNAQNELQSKGPAANDTIYLATENALTLNTEWTGAIRYTAGGPSTSNQVRVYLAADESDLEGALNGYFLQIGESGSNDAVELYRQDGNDDSLLLRGTDGVAGSGIDFAYRIQRDGAGRWTLEIDADGDRNWEDQGSVTDTKYLTSAWFGFWVKHSSTRNEAFFFDDVYVGTPQGPMAQSLSIDGNDSLTVSFSTALANGPAQNVNNFTILPGDIKPISASLQAPDSRSVGLKFAAKFTQNADYELIINGQEDQNGTPEQQPDTLPFRFFLPEDPEPGDVFIHEIFPDPTPAVGLPEGEYVELRNTSSKTFSTENWTFTNGTNTATMPALVLPPGGYVLLVPSGDESLWTSFGDVIGLSPWTSLVNGGDDLGLRDATGQLLDTVNYRISWYGDDDKDDGGYSLELIATTSNSCPPIANWSASQSPAGGTPGAANSLGSLVDVTPPVFESASVIAPDTIRLCFDEALDRLLAEDAVNYGSAQIAVAQAVAVSPDFSCVDFILDSPLQEGVLVQISASRLADCKGNLIANNIETEVLLSPVPEFGDLIINEIFPDFSPQIGLPEAEFVELFNRSSKVFELSDWGLTDGGSVGRFPSSIFMPGEHLILCGEDDTSAFSSFGKVLGISGFPGLNNDNDELLLLSPDDDTVDRVAYDASWYADSEKDNGGWTLERIDPEVFDCNLATNWRASDFPAGGTPGFENSVRGILTDEEAPVLLSVGAGSREGVFILYFSEPILRAASFNLESIGSPDTVSLNETQVRLVFSTMLSQGVSYRLDFVGLEDCFGNELTGSALLGLPEPLLEGDLLLNEILFNPFTGGNDFVEIANVSNKIIDLLEVGIGEGIAGVDTVFNSDPVAEESRFIFPGEIVCLTTNIAIQQENYLPPDTAKFIQLDAFPSYDDAEGVVVLFTSDGFEILELDRFHYLDDYHFITLADKNGVSLERLSLENPTQDPANWHSAASTVNFATPGYANSQRILLNEAPTSVSLAHNLISPDGDSRDDVLTIQYDFDQIGVNARVYVYDIEGRLVKRITENQLLNNQQGFFTWDGSTDKEAKALAGAYVILVEALLPDGKRELYKLPCAVVLP